MESANPIIWSPEAEGDLENALVYLEQNWPSSVTHEHLTFEKRSCKIDEIY